MFIEVTNELVVSLKSHHTDDVNIRKAKIIRDFAGQFRLGYWIFIVPGADKTWTCDKYERPENLKRKWDGKATKILEKMFRILPSCNPANYDQ